MAKKAVKKSAKTQAKPARMKDLKVKDVSAIKGGRSKGGAIPLLG